jgi:hypothetical protein
MGATNEKDYRRRHSVIDTILLGRVTYQGFIGLADSNGSPQDEQHPNRVFNMRLIRSRRF